MTTTVPSLTLAAWLHDLNPFVVRFTEGFGVRWYGLAYLLGFACAYLVLRFLARRRFTPLPAERALDAILILVFGVMIGGRLGYILLYEPSLAIDFQPTPPFWGALALNRGGMASHGGMVGVVVASWIICRGFRRDDGTRAGRCPMLHVGDLCALMAPFGIALGRLANFVNGELLGRIVSRAGEPAPPWAVRFPQEILERPRAELALTDAQSAALDRVCLSYALPGDTLEDGFARALARLQRGDADARAAIEPLISARVPSQLLAALLEGVLVGLVVWWIARRPRRPGVIGCWWLISYGVARIADELVRLPDAGLGRTLGLSRGQWLSALMILVGAFLLVVIRRRGREPMGGWATAAPRR